MNRYRPIYLNDHLAVATLAVELAKRMLRENPGGELGECLRALVPQLVEDRAALIVVVRAQGAAPSALKSGGAWLGEKLGRLKPNGHLATYSPLSRLVELDALGAAVEAKRSLWLALQAAGIDGLDERIARAQEQRAQLEPHRLAAARAALG